MSLLTAGEMSKKYLVTQKALSHYVDKKLLKPVRAAGNARLYTEADQVRLEVILKARDLGFSLRDISRLAKLKTGEVRPGLSLARIVPRATIEDHIEMLQHKCDRMQNALEQLRGLLKAVDEETPV